MMVYNAHTLYSISEVQPSVININVKNYLFKTQCKDDLSYILYTPCLRKNLCYLIVYNLKNSEPILIIFG